MDIVSSLLRTIAAGDVAATRDAARSAHRAEPHDALVTALATYLDSTGTSSVYDEPTAFDEFISFGGNPPMYERTIEALRSLQERLSPATVIDIGCGDGRVTAPSMSASVRRLDLLEPSRALLDTAVEATTGRAIEIRPICASLTEHLSASADRWDFAQSTFALHNLDAAARKAAFTELRGRTGVLAIVEFDVPAHHPDSDAYFEFLARSYALGVAEYLDHPNVVQGFLMPVLIGQLDPARTRYTFEQPADTWCAELRAAGFTTERTLLFDYWWSPATLIVAS